MKTLVLAFLFASTAAFAQERGSTPPGQSQDGSRPQDGAIVGGNILPGEKSGMPDAKPTLEEREKRCMELNGALRDECLMSETGASSGGSVAPESQSGTPPRTSPPPQVPPVLR